MVREYGDALPDRPGRTPGFGRRLVGDRRCDVSEGVAPVDIVEPVGLAHREFERVDRPEALE